MVGHAQRRQLAHWIVNVKAFSQQRACRLAGLSRRMFAYQSKRQPDTEVEQVIQIIARRHPGWGEDLSSLTPLRSPLNHKRLWRIYRQLGLNLPRRKRKRLPERVRQPLPKAMAVNQVWSLDFMRQPRCLMPCEMVADFERSMYLMIIIEKH